MNNKTVQAISPRIMIVDDDDGIRDILGEALEDQGYRVITADSGCEALEILNEETVDLVISDVRMPDGDGGYLLDQVKAREPDRPPIILMSGFSHMTRSEAMGRGANDFFHKPCRLDELLDAIEARLGPRIRAQ